MTPDELKTILNRRAQQLVTSQQNPREVVKISIHLMRLVVLERFSTHMQKRVDTLMNEYDRDAVRVGWVSLSPSGEVTRDLTEQLPSELEHILKATIREASTELLAALKQYPPDQGDGIVRFIEELIKF